MTEVGALTGWTPIGLRADRSGGLKVEWCFTEGKAFTEPFFTDTLDECMREPFRLLFRRRTPIAQLTQFVAESPGLPFAGFVFHVSRCGSTLVSQILASMSEHLVLSEPPVIDAILRATVANRAGLLRSGMEALAQPKTRAQRRAFVKFDAWSVVDFAVVRAAFPSVPCLFLYRDPVAVLASHTRRWGAHVVPGVLPADYLAVAPEGLSVVEYAARVLAKICEAGLAAAHDPLVRLVHYEQLPEFVVSTLSSAWSLDFDESRVRQVARRDAKNPAVEFDRAHHVPSAQVCAAAERWLSPVYARLEAARDAQ